MRFDKPQKSTRQQALELQSKEKVQAKGPMPEVVKKVATQPQKQVSQRESEAGRVQTGRVKMRESIRANEQVLDNAYIEKNPIKPITVQTPYGAYEYLPTREEWASRRKGADAMSALARKAQAQGIAEAKKAGMTETRPSTPTYQDQTESKSVDTLTKEILGNLENIAVSAVAPNIAGARQKVIEAGQAISKGGQESGNLITQFGGGMIEGAMSPVSNFIGSTGNLYDSSATNEERFGAAGNVALYGLGAAGNAGAVAGGIRSGNGVRPSLKGILNGMREGANLGTPILSNDRPSLKGILSDMIPQVQDLTPTETLRMQAKVGRQSPVAAPSAMPGAEMPAFQPSPSKVPDVGAGDVPENLTGYAKQITGRDPMPGTNPSSVLDAGRKAVADGTIAPDAVVSRVISTNTPMSSVEIGATLDELNRIRARMRNIEQATDGDVTKIDEWIQLNGKAEQFQTAGDITGNEWHRTGQALQIALREDMSLQALRRRAKFFNGGDNLEEAQGAKFQELSKKYETALQEMEKLKKESSRVVDEIKRYRGTERFSQRSRERARETAFNYFSGEKQAASGGVGKNKQRGALSYTISNDELKARSAIRKLAKEIALDGAETLDDVLDGIRREIGIDVKDDSLLAMIYEPYSKYRLEADVARIQANNALNDVKRAAEFRAQSNLGKTLSVVEGTLNGLTRSMMLGADLSAPLIQGRKGITNNPSGWVKAFKPMLGSATAKDSERYALQHLASIEQDPLFPRAKAAKLSITTPGGQFSSQEENFIGNMSRILEIAQNAQGAGKVIKVIQPYVSLMVRSENAFTSYMNELRFSTFKKFAELAPNDPQYLADVAAYINVIYGRGTGNMAQAAGNLKLGRGLLAPRYLVSQLQFQSGSPIVAAKSPAARRLIVKQYAKYIAAVSGLMYTAKLMGWDSQTDLRSTDSGKISDGKITIDIASKDLQFWRLAMQNLYGKINQVGGYAEPSFENSAKVNGQFLQGKLAPLPKVGTEIVFGQFTDAGKRVPIEEIPKRDQMLRVAPLWVQDLVKDSEKWDSKSQQALFTILGIMGQESKPKPIKDSEVPLQMSKFGIYSGS